MSNQLISIQEAAELSKKSIQTIRRAIKAKKLIVKKQKTPQGFNYMVNHESLCNLYKIKIEAVKTEKIKSEKVEAPKKAKEVAVESDDFNSLVKALEAMVAQHSEERQNFLRLMNTLQEKIFVLENQLNLRYDQGQDESK